MDYIDADPAGSVRKPGQETPRQRYLDEREIRLVWRACDKIGDPVGRLYKLLLLLGQRRGEVAGMLRSELGKLQYTIPDPIAGKAITAEGDAWLLPASRTKRKKDHAVPLPRLALDLIEGAPKLATIDGKLFDHVLASGACGDAGVTGWRKYRERLDELIGKEIAEELSEPYDPARHVLPDWHIHDLRATCATMMETRLNVPTRVVSRVLNHAEGDGKSMTARYVRHSWDREAADALDRWSDLVSRIVGLNVVPLAASGL
jgi:integrase